MESQKSTVLIVEDDVEISSMISEFLSQNGFSTSVAANGVEGLHMALAEPYSCILLDLMLPYKSGDAVLMELRNVSETPVIVLSAKGLTQSKIELLELGADDYITKPFDLHELLARINANIKHANANQGSNTPICFGSIVLDTAAKMITLDGLQVDLTAKEYSIMELLMKNPEKVFSKQNLYESVWGNLYMYDNDTINTHISNLRKKLGGNVVKTVWGMGYKLSSLENL